MLLKRMMTLSLTIKKKIATLIISHMILLYLSQNIEDAILLCSCRLEQEKLIRSLPEFVLQLQQSISSVKKFKMSTDIPV